MAAASDGTNMDISGRISASQPIRASVRSLSQASAEPTTMAKVPPPATSRPVLSSACSVSPSVSTSTGVPPSLLRSPTRPKTACRSG